MRKRKPKGNHKPHSADMCAICAKPKKYRTRTLLKEKVAVEMSELDEPK